MARTYFITGTDTDVGKTVLTTLLIRHLRRVGAVVRAAKPICSGGRDDARTLHNALEGSMTLDEINPWHFTAPIAPVLAARRAGRKIVLAEVVQYLRNLRKATETFLVEGAGGLLSPLGENFSSLELIQELRARPIIVCPNRLGAVNQVRLVLTALPPGLRKLAQVVLVSPARHAAVARLNVDLLAEFLPPERIHELPWLPGRSWRKAGILPPKVRRCLDGVIAS
ncbi:MAG: dethiobiotin synthase [Opitutaceae bacterium]|nr:dethiobiotin synthase [Verrucomicrobiales bacterium]